MSELTDALAQFDGMWNEIPEDTGTAGEYENLPDGKYQAYINEVNIGESKTGGRLQMKWDLIVCDGQANAGRHIFRYSGLESQENLTFLKRDLGRCGITLEKLSDLEGRLTELLDIIVEVQLKTKTKGTESYQNSYINKMIGKLSEGGVPFTDEDCPF